MTNPPKSLTSPSLQRLEFPLFIHAIHTRSAVFCLACPGAPQNNVHLWFSALGSSILQHLLQVALLKVTLIHLKVSMSYVLLLFTFCADRLFFIPVESQFQNQPKDNQSVCPCPAAFLLGSHLLKPPQREPTTSLSLCLTRNITVLFILWPSAIH